MSEINKDDLIKRMDGAISSFNGDLTGLRTGRASTNMVDGIMIDAYGQKMPIDQVGSISVPEARMISIQVWDKGLVIAVEKAIHEFQYLSLMRKEEKNFQKLQENMRNNRV